MEDAGWLSACIILLDTTGKAQTMVNESDEIVLDFINLSYCSMLDAGCAQEPCEGFSVASYWKGTAMK